MADDGLFTPLLLAFREFAEPLLDAFDSPEALEFFFYQHGWRISLDDTTMNQLNQALPVGVAGRELRQVADTVLAARGSGADPSPEDLARLADAVATLAETLGALSPSSLAGLTGPLGDAATWEDLAEQVFDTLLEQYLRQFHRVIYLILLVSGCLRYQAVTAAAPFRIDCVRPVFDWDQPRALLADPSAALAATYHWDEAATPFDHERLLDSLDRVLRALGVATAQLTPGLQLDPSMPPDTAALIRRDADGLRATLLQGLALAQRVTYEVGFDVLPAAPASQGVPSGLVIRPRLKGGVAEPIPIGQSFQLTVAVDASVGDVVGVSLFPGDVALVGGDVAAGTAVELTAASTDPYYLVGTAGSSRLEVRSPSIRVSLEGTVDDGELRLRLGTAGDAANPGARVVIPMGQADAFVHDTVGANDLTFSFSPEVIWSSATGFAVNGSLTPKVTLPLAIKVGSFTLTNATVGLASAPDTNGKAGYQLRAGVDAAGSIGPVTVAVAGLGFAVDLVPYSRQDLRSLPPGAHRPALGNLDVDLHFAAPTGAGLSVDAAGVITGGGFLVHDETANLYAGVLDLTLRETLTLKAVGLISTRMPDGSSGYSLLVLITAADFPPIELGMGFQLLGIGGLIGIHRTFDDTVMRASLKSDSLATILFPPDPIRNAPAVIRNLTAVFPPRRGSYLLGLMAKIGRQTPPITLDLAVVYEFGSRRRLIVLGRISSLLPTADEDLVRLRLDAVGVVDLDAGTVAIDAVLVDSKLAHKYALSGAMALRARFGSGSGQAFVLAIGGFNPHYTPPSGVPALDRVSIALASGDNPRLTCEAYFALTSNSVQFGARAQLHAAAYGFSIDGDIGFDVLVQFNPFGFIADFHASVQLKHGSTNLFTVAVDGELQGPRPLRVSGEASFEICWCDFSVRFDKTLVSGEAPPLPPGPDVVDELTKALADPQNWRVLRAANRQPGISLRQRAPGAGVLVDPLGVLSVAQQVVPLNTGRDIDLFGGAPLTGATRFTVTVAMNGSAQDPSPVLDQFAPSQFFSLTDDEKISGPAFEQLQSGMSFGTGAPIFDDAEVVDVSLDYDTLVMDALDQPPHHLPQPYTVDGDQLRSHLRLSALTQSALRSSGPARFRDESVPAAATLNQPRWSVVSLDDDAVTAPRDATSGTYSDALTVLAAANRGDGPAGWQLISTFGPAS